MNQPPLLTQIISMAGALLCLVAYVGHQLHWMDAKKWLYSVLNLLGGGILCYVALRPFQAGFVLMEGVWTFVSLFALVKYLRRKTL